MTGKRRSIVIAASLVTLGIGGVTYNVVHKTQDEIATGCSKALIARGEPSPTRPEACEGLTEDNYDKLVIHSIMVDQGYVDDDPNTEDTPEDITRRILEKSAD